MPADLAPAPPRTVDGFLNLIAQPIFGGGLAWAVIESTWPVTRDAFDRFSVKKVAAYTDVDVARLLATEGVISNVAKIRAVIRVANELQAITKQHGSVRKWLDGCDGHDARLGALRSLSARWTLGCVLRVGESGLSGPDMVRIARVATSRRGFPLGLCAPRHSIRFRNGRGRTHRHGAAQTPPRLAAGCRRRRHRCAVPLGVDPACHGDSSAFPPECWRRPPGRTRSPPTPIEPPAPRTLTSSWDNGSPTYG